MIRSRNGSGIRRQSGQNAGKMRGGTFACSSACAYTSLAPSIATAVAIAFVVFSATPTAAASTLDVSSIPSSWYQRYEHYPPYCATPSEMANRSIPPLANDARPGGSQLLHATVMIRHGARTPWRAGLSCWDGYNEDPSQVWNCTLKTWLATPSEDQIAQLDDEATFHSGAAQHQTYQEESMAQATGFAVYEKRYDALMDPADNLRNEFNGTCQMGQLLLRGYHQEIANGEHLRRAYIYDSTNSPSSATGSGADAKDDDDTNTDQRLNLIDVGEDDAVNKDDPWDVSNLYFRVDDDQRTLMSGQVFIRGLIGQEIQSFVQRSGGYTPIIPLHVADRYGDILGPNGRVCPALNDLREEFEQTDTFQSYNTSQEVQTLRRFQREVLGLPNADMDTIDCLMTTMCTDRPLPESLNDYRPPSPSADSNSGDDPQANPHHQEYGTDLFQRLLKLDSKLSTMVYTANDSEYAKVSMGPMWAEVLPNLEAFTAQQPPKQVCCPKRPPSKLALFSAHDTTVMPIMAALGPRVFDGEWAPYASMFIIEIHAINLNGNKDATLYPSSSDRAFRLLYNGEVRTHLMDGCPPDTDLCDIAVLMDRIRPFAKRHRPCEGHQDASAQRSEDGNGNSDGDSNDQIPSMIAKHFGFFVLMTTVLSAMAGSFLTYGFLLGFQRPVAWRTLGVTEEDCLNGDVVEFASNHSVPTPPPSFSDDIVVEDLPYRDDDDDSVDADNDAQNVFVDGNDDSNHEGGDHTVMFGTLS